MHAGRRVSTQVMIGKVAVGGGAPIVVQSMTNTDTADADATARQVFDLWRAGSELVRITVNTPEAAAQVAAIRARLDAMGCDVPLIRVYRELARRCAYALHLGLTEAGMGSKGIVASTAAMAVLLQEGIGDTIRVSLTPEPGGDRTREVIVAQELLQTMGLRSFSPLVAACPGCGRTTSTTFQELAQRIQEFLRAQMPAWKLRYPGVEEMKVAVMGCVVNGPGESKHADVGISLPGTNETPVAPVYVDGEKTVTLKGARIAEEFQAIVENYVKDKYSGSNSEPRRKEIKIKAV